MALVTLLSGSPSPTSRSGALLNYAARRLEDAGHETVLFSVRDFPAEDVLYGRYDSPVFTPLQEKIAAAAGLVVSTPVYKASYTGALKTLLDLLPQTALRGKTVLPFASGGTPAHQLMIDYALKPVLSALGATDLLQGVYLVDAQSSLGPNGELVLNDELQQRLDRSLDQLAALAHRRPAASG